MPARIASSPLSTFSTWTSTCSGSACEHHILVALDVDERVLWQYAREQRIITAQAQAWC
jgi:hypothetical protein